MRRCSRCGQEKPLEDFVRNRSARTGRGYHCRPCHNRVSRENRELHHGSVRNFQLKRRYGIDADHVAELIQRQDGLCAICVTRQAKHVDHDHDTGNVGGVLCFSCNGALGQFRDDSDRLAAALEYLHSAEELKELFEPRGQEPLMLCCVCREWLTPTRFGKNHRRRRGLNPWCKRCGESKGREVAKKNRFGGARRYHLLGKYGIDVHELDELIKDQRGLCALCREQDAQQVDHDHASGHIRGVLCGGCNAGLGQFMEDPEIIRRAIDYLKRHRPDSVQEPSVPYILSVA